MGDRRFKYHSGLWVWHIGSMQWVEIKDRKIDNETGERMYKVALIPRSYWWLPEVEFKRSPVVGR